MRDEPGLKRLLVDLRPAEVERISAILAACPTIDLEAGVPYFRNSFPAEALLVVQDGFIVVRASAAGRSRTVIWCRWVHSFLRHPVVEARPGKGDRYERPAGAAAD